MLFMIPNGNYKENFFEYNEPQNSDKMETVDSYYIEASGELEKIFVEEVELEENQD